MKDRSQRVDAHAVCRVMFGPPKRGSYAADLAASKAPPSRRNARVVGFAGCRCTLPFAHSSVHRARGPPLVATPGA